MDVPEKERYVRSYPMVKGSAQKKEVQARTIMARPDILANLPAPDLTPVFSGKGPLPPRPADRTMPLPTYFLCFP